MHCSTRLRWCYSPQIERIVPATPGGRGGRGGRNVVGTHAMYNPSAELAGKTTSSPAASLAYFWGDSRMPWPVMSCFSTAGLIKFPPWTGEIYKNTVIKLSSATVRRALLLILPTFTDCPFCSCPPRPPLHPPPSNARGWRPLTSHVGHRTPPPPTMSTGEGSARVPMVEGALARTAARAIPGSRRRGRAVLCSPSCTPMRSHPNRPGRCLPV